MSSSQVVKEVNIFEYQIVNLNSVALFFIF